VPNESQYRESFACNPTEARRARKAIAAFAQTWLKGADATDFESAVGEALANAINHGKCKRLNVACRFACQELVAEIAQQNGEPFEPPATSAVPAAGTIGGYGLFIMRAVLDKLEYRENGKCVRLVKRAARV
jgi:anti-sigma regulatory factor (Ser/Thr protein kinase)